MDEVRRGRPRSGTLRFASLSEAQNSPLMPRASREVQFAHSLTATIDDTLLTSSPRPDARLATEADTYTSSLTNQITASAGSQRAETEQVCDIMWLPSVAYKSGPRIALSNATRHTSQQQYSAAGILPDNSNNNNNSNMRNVGMMTGSSHTAPPPLLSLLPCDSAANSATEPPRHTAGSYWSSANVTPRSTAAFSPSEKAHSPARPRSLASHSPQSSPGRTFSQLRRFAFGDAPQEGLLVDAQKTTQAISELSTLPPPPPPPSVFVLDARPMICSDTQRDPSDEPEAPRAALSSTRAMPSSPGSPSHSVTNEAVPLITLAQPSTSALHATQSIVNHTVPSRDVAMDGPLPCTTTAVHEEMSSLWGSSSMTPTHCMKYISVGGGCQGWRRTMEDRQVLFPLYAGSHTGAEEVEFATMTSTVARAGGGGPFVGARRMPSGSPVNECATESSQAFLTLETTEWGSVSCTSPPSQALPPHTISVVGHKTALGTSHSSSPVFYRDPNTHVAPNATQAMGNDFVFCSPRGEQVSTTTTTTTMTTTATTSAAVSPRIEHTSTAVPHVTLDVHAESAERRRSSSSVSTTEDKEEEEDTARPTGAAIQKHIHTQEGSPLITRTAAPTTQLHGGTSYSTSVATTRHESPLVHPPVRLSHRANTPPLPPCSSSSNTAASPVLPIRHRIRGGFALLLDGHRGATAAEFVARHLPSQLLRALHTEHTSALDMSDVAVKEESAGETSEAATSNNAWWASELPATSALWRRRYTDFVRSFVAVDQMLYDAMHGTDAQTAPPEPTGTTVTVAFADRHTLTIAQLGDSRAYLIERRPDAYKITTTAMNDTSASSVSPPPLASSPLALRGAPGITSSSSSCPSPTQSPLVLPAGLHIRRLTEEHRPAVCERERERLQRLFGCQAFQPGPGVVRCGEANAMLTTTMSNSSSNSPALRPVPSPMSRPMLDKAACSPCTSSVLCSPCGHLSPDYLEARLSRRTSGVDNNIINTTSNTSRVRGRLGVSRALGDFDLKTALHLPWPTTTVQRAEGEESKQDDEAGNEGLTTPTMQEQQEKTPTCHAAERAHLGWLVTAAELRAMGHELPPCVTSDEPLLSPLLVSNVPQVRTYRRGQLPPLVSSPSHTECCSYDALVLGCDGVWELQSIEPIAKRIDDALQPLLRRQPVGACYCNVTTTAHLLPDSIAHSGAGSSSNSNECEEKDTVTTRWIAEVEQTLKEVVRTTLQAGIAPWCPAVNKGVPGLDNLSLSIILLLS